MLGVAFKTAFPEAEVVILALLDAPTLDSTTALSLL